MRNSIVTFLLAALLAIPASARFHTITKETAIEGKRAGHRTYGSENKEENIQTANATDSLRLKKEESAKNHSSARKRNNSTLPKKGNTRTKDKRPELTIPNLYEEIRKNDLKYPKVVLAQAILETGWFRSPACRNRNNLFGLTNPRTGKYYEFDHWTDSVRAYYDKVQYRFKGGNYLLWLQKIGYAEDPEYVRAVIRVMKML